jgi:hypothetical protein
MLGLKMKRDTGDSSCFEPGKARCPCQINKATQMSFDLLQIDNPASNHNDAGECCDRKQNF